LSRAFGTVAAGAQNFEPHGIRAIRGPDQPLYTRTINPPSATDNDRVRAAMLDVLMAVTREGTARSARLAVPVGGKTGTTQENRDAWFIGFTPDLLVGIWVGNDDNTPTNNVTGGDLPATIWRDFVSRASAVAGKRKGGQGVAQARAPAATGSLAPASMPAGAIRGRAEVVDTATLEIGGRTVRLLGVAVEDGRAARQLARFLRRRELVCDQADSGETHRCRVDGEDLSTIILVNGGARASPDAPPELLAAENEARTTRQGVWRRRR
jgi:penicillin-binding protein 1A